MFETNQDFWHQTPIQKTVTGGEDKPEVCVSSVLFEDQESHSVMKVQQADSDRVSVMETTD